MIIAIKKDRFSLNLEEASSCLREIFKVPKSINSGIYTKNQ